MFTQSDIANNRLFLKTVQALTPQEDQQDFILNVCKVFDGLADLVREQVHILQMMNYPPRIHPMIEECLLLVVHTLINTGSEGSIYVKARPKLQSIIQQYLQERVQ